MSDRKSPLPLWNGQRLKQLREARGLTVPELAEMLGCDKSQVYKWQTGTTPGADYLAAFALIFDRPAMDFITGVDDFREHIASLELRREVETREAQLHAERLAQRFSSGEIQKRASSRARQQPERPARSRRPSRPSAQKPDDDPSE